MPATYYINLKDQAGARVAVFDAFYRLQYHLHRNEPGWCKLHLDLPDDRSTLFDLDGQIEVYRRGDWDGADWYIDMETLHRRLEYQTLRTGQDRFLSWGLGYLDLLARRIGLYWLYNNDAYTADGFLVVNDTPPDIIGEFVNREAGPGAIYGAVDRRTTGLTLAAIVPAGAAVTEQLRNTNLLERVQEVADGYDLDMRIVGNGPALFEFQVAPLLGTDRRVGNPFANPPVVFSLGFGNMALPHYIEDNIAIVNHIFVGGQGTELDRMIYDEADAALVAASPWNLHEAFEDARELDTYDKLEDRATTELEEGLPITDLSFQVIDTDGCKYGRDWVMGDLITAIYREVQQNYRIESVEVVVDNRGVERITVDLVEVE